MFTNKNTIYLDERWKYFCSVLGQYSVDLSVFLPLSLNIYLMDLLLLDYLKELWCFYYCF